MKKTINEIHVRFRGKFAIKKKLTEGDVLFLIKGDSQERKITSNHDGSVDITYIIDILDGEKVKTDGI